jgi:hypothetical protein
MLVLKLDAVAASTIVVWDYRKLPKKFLWHAVAEAILVVTFEQEVNLVWRARWSLGKFLFLLVCSSHSLPAWHNIQPTLESLLHAGTSRVSSLPSSFVNGAKRGPISVSIIMSSLVQH